MAEGAETNRQIFDRVTVGVLRSLMVPDLKNYMDLTKTTERQEYQMLQSNGKSPNLIRETSSGMSAGTNRGIRTGTVPEGNSHRTDSSLQERNHCLAFRAVRLVTCLGSVDRDP